MAGLIGLFLFCQPVAGQEEAGAAGTTPAQEPRKEVYSRALQPWFGDYEDMVERRMVRIAVPYSMTHYFLDGASERGVSAAMGRALESEINRRENRRTRLIDVVFIPAPRSSLHKYVTSGLADVAMGGIAVTPAAATGISYSIPFIRESKLVLVTGPRGFSAENTDDLVDRTIYVQRTGGYLAPLQKLSNALRQGPLAAIDIAIVEDELEPDEILELVQSGQIPATILDNYLVDFWRQVFPHLTVHPDIVIGPPRDIAWIFRADSPGLEQVLNEFLRTHRQRAEFGNVVLQRYLQNTRFVSDPTATRNWSRFEQTRPLFQKYGNEYQLDPLLLAALGYQESRLQQSTRSPAGAVGVMQLLPKTGASLGVGDITELDANIHAGTKYLSSLMESIDVGEQLDPLNRQYFALASYNAGQTRIRRLRRQAEQQGLDPNLWHNNVELLVAREIGRETVQYVDNIYKYYLAYRRVGEQRAKRAERAGDISY